MTLLNATSTLIDAVRTYAPEGDRTIDQAVKRMEKRLAVLQARQQKQFSRIREEAFFNAMGRFGGGVVLDKGVIICTSCKGLIGFEEFCKHAIWTGRGLVESLTCPECSAVMSEAREQHAGAHADTGGAAEPRLGNMLPEQGGVTV